MSDTTPQLAPPKDHAFLIIAMILAAMFGGVLLLLMFVPIPQENKDLLNILLGVLGGSFTTMVAWVLRLLGQQSTEDFVYRRRRSHLH